MEISADGASAGISHAQSDLPVVTNGRQELCSTATWPVALLDFDILSISQGLGSEIGFRCRTPVELRSFSSLPDFRQHDGM